jgi:hypothetical protein
VLAAGAIADADGGFNSPQPSLRTFFVVAGGLFTLLLLEFVAISVEVTDKEVRYSISPFYRRSVLIADIQHWEVRVRPNTDFSGIYYYRAWKRPTHAVEVTLNDGSQVAFICLHAEHLAHAISRAKDIMSHPLQASASS